MPDYDADCLWDDVTGVMVPKSDVPLSESLKCRLTAWRKRWEELAEGAWHRDEDTREDAAWADHQRDERKLWMALREELGSDFEVGLAVPSPGGPDTRVHVIWSPGGKPELPIWHQRHKWEGEEGQDD